LTLAPLVVAALWIGLYPKPIFDVLRAPSENIVRAVGGKTDLPPALALETAAEPAR
jgi:NADH:ubiquinone oxidoreductase subunit 4 (subunit M)